MVDLSQFVAGGSAEVGIQGQYLDGELHLVDHALSGSVAAVEKFKIPGIIIASSSIDMMNCFFGQQIASDHFGHDVAVFENSSSFSGRTGECRDRQIHVPMALSVAPHVTFIEPVQSDSFERRVFAFDAAIFLRAVDTKVLGCARSVFQFAAVLACEFISFVCILTSSGFRTIDRAVKRGVFVFFLVCSKICFHHHERLAAFFARKMHRGSAFGRRSFLVQVSRSAFSTAVFTTFFGFAGMAVKRLFAVHTIQLERHLYKLLVWQWVHDAGVSLRCQVV